MDVPPSGEHATHGEHAPSLTHEQLSLHRIRGWPQLAGSAQSTSYVPGWHAVSWQADQSLHWQVPVHVWQSSQILVVVPKSQLPQVTDSAAPGAHSFCPSQVPYPSH